MTLWSGMADSNNLQKNSCSTYNIVIIITSVWSPLEDILWSRKIMLKPLTIFQLEGTLESICSVQLFLCPHKLAFCFHNGLEWPSPHDCTSSVWDTLVFISVIEPPALSERLWVKNVFCSLFNTQFVFHLVPPLLTQLPHLPTYPAHFAMAKPMPLLN
jgi:hypothetical protein